MNRDEHIARAVDSPPEKVLAEGTSAVYPLDLQGNTWVGANDHGISLALLNWNNVFPAGGMPVSKHSRGIVIPAVIHSRSMNQVRSALRTVQLESLLPFRLFGVFPAMLRIREWRWDTVRFL